MFERIEKTCKKMSFRIKTKLFIWYFGMKDHDRFLEYYESDKQIRLINPLNRFMLTGSFYKKKLNS